MLARFELAEDFELSAGPGGVYLLNESDWEPRTFFFNINIGGSYFITEEIAIEGRYTIGLSDMSPDSDFSMKKNSFHIGLAIKL